VGHTDEVWSAQFIRGETAVATASKDRTLRLWDAGSGAALATYPLPAGTRQLVARSDGALLGARTTHRRRVDPAARRGGGRAADARGGAPARAFVSPDGRRMIVQPDAGEAYVRDLDDDARQRCPGPAARRGGGSSIAAARSRST
jgi:hypothetical protein